jgi:rhamnulokinase
VDTWGVDYGLFDADGELIEEPVCYRDSRTEGAMEKVFEKVSRGKIFEKTGIQFLVINTLYQLYSQVINNELPAETSALLLMPDIFNYLLCGAMGNEYTMASTSQLLGVTSRKWEKSLFDALHLPYSVMNEIVMPGRELGILREEIQKSTGMGPIRVVTPAAHDTASAVAATPLENEWAYISSGTWSLVGIETSEPITDSKALEYNFTNEGGVYGTYRFLKNVMGLWILESCRKEWKSKEGAMDYNKLIEEMEKAVPFQALINPDDPYLLNPDSMLSCLNQYFKSTGQAVDFNQVQVSRIILESLALRYSQVVREIEVASSSKIRGIHIVGGGSQNIFLNQATADAAGVPVRTGPVEATAIGNILVQAISQAQFKDLAEAREYIRKNTSINAYKPGNDKRWQKALEDFDKHCVSRQDSQGT